MKLAFLSLLFLLVSCTYVKDFNVDHTVWMEDGGLNHVITITHNGKWIYRERIYKTSPSLQDSVNKAIDIRVENAVTYYKNANKK